MGPTRRRLLAAAAGGVAGALAGCTGDLVGTDGESTGTTTTEEQPTSETTDQSMTTAESEQTLAVHSVESVGDIVVGPDGRSLYMFEPDPDDGSESVCTGDCADAWPPLTVGSAETVSVPESITGSVGTLERTDGRIQVTLGGWPLYYFQGDSARGDVTGQGVNRVWWLIDPAGTPVEPLVQVRSTEQYGPILTGPDGRSLYMFDQDTQGSGESVCTDGCASAWPPLDVDSTRTLLASQAVTGEVGTIERPDGSMQVTVAGWPLYYFQNDAEEGDVNGQGVNDVWWVLGPDGTVIRDSQSATTTTTDGATTDDSTSTTTQDSDDGGSMY